VKRGGLAAVLTVLFAVAAAAAVFMYAQGARRHAENGTSTVPVLVATTDIPAGAALDPLIEAGDFRVREIPADAVVQSVIQDVSQLRGQTTAYPILANEQISAARLRGGYEVGGGTLGIADGMQAWSVSLDPERVAAGAIQQNDHVEIYGTFELPKNSDAHITKVLVPDARVLWTSAPPGTDASTTSGSGQITLTIEVTPQDAELLTYSQELASIWATLLPPNQKGVRVGPVVTKGVTTS
jgi:pilus assembly protein CpaB